MSNHSWKGDFLNCLELGTTNTSLAKSFNQIVEWMRRGREDDSLYFEFEARYSEEWVFLRYEEFLDRLFISETAAALIFPPSMESDEAKKRYRQLIRIFHPDRGVHEEVWLNYRAERINKAFKKYEKKLDAPVAEIVSPNVNATSSAAVSRNKTSNAEFRISTKIKYKPNFLREKLGSAREVQNRIVAAVVCCAVLLVLLVYASSRDAIPSTFEKDAEPVIVQSRGESESEQNSSVVVNSPKVQKILDEAEWLNVSSRDSQAGISPGEMFDNIDASNDTVNFSNFDTQNQKSIGESHRMHAVVGGSKSDEPELSKSRAVKSQRAPVTHAAAAQNNAMKSKVRRSDHRPPKTDGGIAQSTARSSFRICDSNIGETMPMAGGRDFRIIADLSVRSGPSESCIALKSLSKGVAVVVQKRVSVEGLVWARVGWRDELGVEMGGWVSEHFLNPLKPLATSVSDSNLNRDRSSRTQKQNIDEVSTENQAVIPRPGTQSNSLKDQAVAVINQLDSAYERGDAESLAALYTSLGRENNIKGLTSIAKNYSKLFKRTHSRTVDYNISSYARAPGDGALLRGTMVSTAIVTSSGRTHRTAATVEFMLVRIGSGYKIESFRWKLI